MPDEASTLALLKQACVLIRERGNYGTGYLVAPRRIATAAHVVKSWRPGERHEVRLGVDEQRPCRAWLVGRDAQGDAALLAFDEAVVAQPLALAQALPGDAVPWRGYGFPGLEDLRPQDDAAVVKGIPLHGTVADAQAGGELALKCDEVVAGNASPLHGLSGSPVLVDGQVAGHLVHHLGDPDDRRRAAFGYVYACPVAAVKRLLDADAQAEASRDLVRDALAQSSFRDPDVLYLLVVAPPGGGAPGGLRLQNQVRLAWDNDRARICAAVDRYRAALRLPRLPRSAPNDGLVMLALDVEAACASMDALRSAAMALARCEAAVFDLTGFDPVVLFLLGVRAVARRGVTVASIGGDFALGKTLTIPFNLQLLNVAAHSKAQLEKALKPHQLIAGKLVTGFQELTDLPHYLDLPAFDAVRELGIGSDAYKPIPYTQKALVLCPFGEDYSERNWKEHIGLELEGRLKAHAYESGQREDLQLNVERVLDARTPRLVAQSLYEAIRLTDLCLVDWTGLRPNVMFEAGVRLATNPLGAVHILEDTNPQLPGHVDRLLAMLNPVRYRCETEGPPYDEMIRRFTTSLADFDAGRRNPLFDAVGAAIDLPSQSLTLPLVDELVRGADLLFPLGQTSKGWSTVLFSEVNKDLAEAAERAAAERRLAAWLFLVHRYSPSDIARDDALGEHFDLLTSKVRRWAREENRPDLLELARQFAARIEDARTKRGDAP